MTAQATLPTPLAQPDPRRWLAFAVILSATLLSVLDFLIVNIALPSIRAELGATDAEMQLTVAGYGLAFAVCLITGGRLGDLYGRKRLFMYGMAGFTLASLLCGFAHTSTQLVAFRIIQGIVAAMMSPQVLASIQVMFQGHERDKAMGMVGAVVGVGSFLGNVLGGFLVGADLFGLSWRPIFFVNVPIGIVALILAFFLVRESKAPVAKKLDVGGAIISGVALFCFIMPIAEGREQGWPWWTFALLTLSVVVGWMFVRYEKRLVARGGAPLIDLELFQVAGYRRGLLSIVLLFSGISSFAFTLTYFLQKGLKVAPPQVGIIFAALSVSFLIASLSAVKIVEKIGPKTLLLGLAIMQGGQILLIVIPLVFGERLNPFAIMPILFLYGLGQGLSIPQIIRQTLADVDNAHAGAAAGVLNTVQQVAFSLGVSVVGSVFFAFIPQNAVAFDYSKALAAAFILNFIFVITARFLVASNIRKMEREGNKQSAMPVVVEV
jgi:EmrB/QacA subfamily drug resistance transporter